MGVYNIIMQVPKPNKKDPEEVTESHKKEELFTSGYIRDADVDRDGILATFGPAAGSFQDCPMQRPSGCVRGFKGLGLGLYSVSVRASVRVLWVRVWVCIGLFEGQV